MARITAYLTVRYTSSSAIISNTLEKHSMYITYKMEENIFLPPLKRMQKKKIPFSEIVNFTLQTCFQVWKNHELRLSSALIIAQKYHLFHNVNSGLKKFNLQLSSENNGNHLDWLVWKSNLIDPTILEPFTEHENRQDNIMISRVNQNCTSIYSVVDYWKH